MSVLGIMINHGESSGDTVASQRRSTMMRSIRSIAALGLIAAYTAACGALDRHPVPSDRTDTLTTGWEQHFTLDWSVESAPNRTGQISGYVVSHDGESVEPLRVLARALDGSGAVVDQQIVWVPGGVGGFGRAYFEIRGLPAADRYVVTVWDYGVLES